ncbi:MAG: hypothetical protein NTW26_10640 [bacterium]|nr:hypothetical protein [bacterium]
MAHLSRLSGFYVRLAVPIALFFISVAFAGPTVVIDAALEGDSISGTLTMALDGADGGELRLYLPANRDRDPSFTGPVEEMGLFSDNDHGIYPFDGWMEITRLSINGARTDDFRVEGVRLTVGHVPEGPLDISVDFTTRVPDFHHLWGRSDNLIVLAGWHPQPWPVDGEGDYLDARELPWGVFPAQSADYEVNLAVEPGWEPLGPAIVDEDGVYSMERKGCRGADLALFNSGAVTEEVWGGLAVELADVTADGSGEARLHFAREVFDRFTDWFGLPEGGLIIIAADAPLSGDEFYDGLVLLGDVPTYPLMRFPELAYARQMAGRWFRTGREVDGYDDPLLVDGLSHWAAREALTSIFGEGRDLLPAAVLGVEQEWLSRTYIEDLKQSGRDRAPSSAADAFDQPETYDAAVRQKTAQALIRWSRRWSPEILREAAARFLDISKTERATPKLFLETIAGVAGYAPAMELAENLGLDAPSGSFEPTSLTPRVIEEPAFEFRILPDALDPEAWTLFLVPFPWPDYDGTWRLGAALWGREGVHLLPMEIWGDDDLLLSATCNIEYGDWNLLAQFTTRLDDWYPGLRLGTAVYSRKDEQGGSLQFNYPVRPRLSHVPELEFILGVNYCRLRSWDPGDRALRLRGEDGRQFSIYGSFNLNDRGALGGPQLHLGAEYALDPLPRLNPEHPPFAYGRFFLRAQEDLRLAPWLWTAFRGAFGHIEGRAPDQRRLELTEDDISFEYDLIRLPQAGEIRGYNDLDLFADDMAVVGAELYTPVIFGVEFGVFFDRGAVADGPRALFAESTPWRSSFGPLLRVRVGDAIYAEFNFPLWVSDPYTDKAEPGGPPWAFRWDFDARIGF